ncbi:hypothetical protein [Caballeronia sp. GAWG1-1]|uniref:hypothetical protein n=2 Tax=Caballeronia TaxID=1827195 RepID=UPI002027A4AA|nr:hypothetical protein [Caballeronia sp. GAWG1-1]
MFDEIIPFTKLQMLDAIQALQAGLSEISQQADAMLEVANSRGLDLEAHVFVVETIRAVAEANHAAKISLGL